MQKSLFKFIAYYYRNLAKKSLFVVLALMILGYFGFLVTISDFITSPIHAYNNSYITAIQELSLRSFVITSGVLSVLAILKSSSAGFSLLLDLNIQYGNLIYPLFELVEKGWYASLASLVVIELIRVTLEYSRILVPFFFTSLLMVYLAEILLVNLKSGILIKKLRQILLYLCLMTYAAIPLYVSVAATASQHINLPLKQKIQNNLTTLPQQLPEKTDDSFVATAKEFFQNLKQASVDSQSKLQYFSKVIIQHILVELLSVVLIPLSFVLFVFYSLRYYRRAGLFLSAEAFRATSQLKQQ